MPSLAPEGGLLLVLARGSAVSATLFVFGVLMFATFVAPRALERAPANLDATLRSLLLRMARFGLAACVLATSAWLVAETSAMAETTNLRDTLEALAPVVSSTWFGRLVLLSMAASVATFAILGRGTTPTRWRAAAAASGLATALQAGHGHALAMHDGPSLLLVSSIVHLLAAGVWVGGLPALLLIVWRSPLHVGAMAARWFTPLGKWCVTGIVGSAAFQSWALIGGLPQLIGTAYGWTALAKFGLFVILLGFAAVNRYRLAPALLQGQPDRACRILMRSVAVQTGFGFMTVLIAALLSSLPPAIHEQPSWPFAMRPSLVMMQDPDLRREVALALLVIAVAIAVASASIAWKRIRWAGLVVAIALIVYALPHLDLLFVEAYPTSFYSSPTGFAAASIVHGAKLFAPHCAACHGVEGRGDGPLAGSLPVPPADLTAAHLWDHDDGEMFWWLSHGMEAPEGGLAMPGFSATLSVDDRWSLIDAVRAHNAGMSMRASGTWSHAVPAPDFSVVCTGGPTLGLADLRGSVVRLLIAGDANAQPLPAPPSQAGIEIADVLVSPRFDVEPQGCHAQDPILLEALSILTDETVAGLAGNQFLIDPNGWLRARWRPSEPGGWEDTTSLLSEIRKICTIRISSNGETHAHH